MIIFDRFWIREQRHFPSTDTPCPGMSLSTVPEEASAPIHEAGADTTTDAHDAGKDQEDSDTGDDDPDPDTGAALTVNS